MHVPATLPLTGPLEGCLPNPALSAGAYISFQVFGSRQAPYSLSLGDLTAKGTTANRPTSYLWIGKPYFDVTLGLPIWWDGTDWIDATGAVV